MQYRFSVGLYPRILPLLAVALIASIGIAEPTRSAESGKPLSCELTKIAEYPLIENENGSPIVTVTIDGKPLKMVLDTGGYWSLIDPYAVRDYPIRNLRGGLRLGLSGIPLTQVVHTDAIQLGELSLPGGDFVLWPPNYNGGGVSGTLGANLLKSFDVEIDPGTMKVRFFLKNHCPGRVIYWPHKDFAELSLRISQGLLTVPLVLDGKEVTAMIDTGAPWSVLSTHSAAATFGLDIPTPPPSQNRLGPAAGRIRAPAPFMHQFETLELDGISFKNPMIEVAFNSQQNSGMVLGMHQLRVLHMYFAYDEEKLYLTTLHGDAEARQEAGSTSESLTASVAPSPPVKPDEQLQHVQVQDLIQMAGDAIKAKNYDLAEAQLDRALKLAPESSRVYVVRAQLDAARDKTSSALKDIGEALRLNPDDVSALRLRAIYEQHSGDYEGALRDADHIVQIQPESTEALDRRCLILAIMGKQLDIALSDCNASIALARRNWGALESRALVYLKTEQWDNAIKDYDTALKIMPKLAESLYGKSVAEQHKGDMTHALADKDAALAIDPDIIRKFGK